MGIPKQWAHDQALIVDHPLGIIGIDEAGRGALAGPVVAAAVWLKASFFDQPGLCEASFAINDSKVLSPQKRATCFEKALTWKEEGWLQFSTASACVNDIASLNILGATQAAMKRSLEQLPLEIPLQSTHFKADFSLSNDPSPLPEGPLIVIDGPTLKTLPWPHIGIIKGDAKSLAIGLASIIAKVTRDQLMKTLDQHYPQYGFAIHKGYGTQKHQCALETFGPCPEHRIHFLKTPSRSTTRELAF